MQVSGLFKSSAKDMRDCICGHDKSTTELIENFEELGRVKNSRIAVPTGDVDTALHVVSVAILGRESKMLLDADELHNPKTLELKPWEKCQTS